MENSVLGSSELSPEQTKHILDSLSRGFERVAESRLEELKSCSHALKEAIDGEDDTETPIKNFLLLDEELKQLGIEYGIIAPDGPAPALTGSEVAAYLILGGVGTMLLIGGIYVYVNYY